MKDSSTCFRITLIKVGVNVVFFLFLVYQFTYIDRRPVPQTTSILNGISVYLKELMPLLKVGIIYRWFV